VIEQLDAADLDDPMTPGGIETRSLRIENNLAHDLSLSEARALRQCVAGIAGDASEAISFPANVSLLRRRF
jgi:hypothetical protein